MSAPTLIGISEGVLHFQLPVSGDPGATVRAQVSDRTDWRDETVLGDDGTGVLDLKANPADLQKDAQVSFDYVVDGVASPTVKTLLSALLNQLAPTAGTAPAE